MKNNKASTIICVILGLQIITAAAFAHGTEKNGKMATTAAQMKKLHAMMPMFSVAAAELESALEKGDVAAAKTEADKILMAVPDLKKSKPHKKVEQRKYFVAQATSLEAAVTSTLDLAKKGDFVGAKAAFKNVEAACASCHAKFRD